MDCYFEVSRTFLGWLRGWVASRVGGRAFVVPSLQCYSCWCPYDSHMVNWVMMVIGCYEKSMHCISLSCLCQPRAPKVSYHFLHLTVKC